MNHTADPFQSQSTQFWYQPGLPFPTEPMLYLNPGSTGYFSLLVRGRDRFHQDSFPMKKLPEVVRYVDQSKDTWISQNQFFRKNRRLVNLSQINTGFSDLDTYRKGNLERLSPEGLALMTLEACEENKIPLPSIILYSGRGIQVKWIFEKPVPRQALPRWNAAQRYLTQGLKSMGADPNSIDGSRVLRLEQTTNTKSGERVRILWPEGDEPVMYDFEILCQEVLPFTREELQTLKTPRERNDDQVQKFERRLRFTQMSLNWARLEDIRKLAYLRGWTQGNPDGSRDPFIFLGAVFCSWVARGNALYWEAESLSKEFAPHWTQSKLFQKVGHYFRMVGQGRRYRFTNQRLIEILEVTPDEERQLKTIISTDEVKRRHREKETARRRAFGAVERQIYEARAKERRENALEMKKNGLSYRQIAEKLGITVRHTIRLLEN